MHFIHELITFLKDSPKKTAIVRRIAEAMECTNTHVRPLYPTRFTVKYHVIDGIYKQLNVIPEALSVIENDTSSMKAASEASGLHRRFSDFEFYLALVISRSKKLTG